MDLNTIVDKFGAMGVIRDCRIEGAYVKLIVTTTLPNLTEQEKVVVAISLFHAATMRCREMTAGQTYNQFHIEMVSNAIWEDEQADFGWFITVPLPDAKATNASGCTNCGGTAEAHGVCTYCGWPIVNEVAA